LVEAETAERLRKPESGTEVGVDSLPHDGARPGMPLKGVETPGKVSSGH